MGSVVVSTDVLLHISVAIKDSFLKFNMCNICKNNIAKMVLVFFSKFKIVDLIEFKTNFVKKIFCAQNLKNHMMDSHKI